MTNNPAAFRVEVLNCQAGRSSGYLVRTATSTIVVDCGPGITNALIARDLLEQLDAVVITHEHADHAADVIGLAYARSFPNPTAQVPLFAPPSTIDVLSRLSDLFAVPSLPAMASTIHTCFDLNTLTMDSTPQHLTDSIGMRSYAMHHAVPSAGLRFAHNGQTIAFSSDTGRCDALLDVAHHADLFICEATYLNATVEELDGHGHLTPELAAVAAEQAGAKHLAITHQSSPDQADQALQIAAEHLGHDSVSIASLNTQLQLTMSRWDGGS